jgi:hypothetical protein
VKESENEKMEDRERVRKKRDRGEDMLCEDRLSRDCAKGRE